MLADYADANRKALRRWLDGDSALFDWSRYVVCDLEGEEEKEVWERQAQVRKLVKAVAHCDLTRDPPIERDYDQLYDVVICSLVFAQSLDEYRMYAARLGKLVKPGGTILISAVENRAGYYIVDGKKFKDIHVTTDFALAEMQDSTISVSVHLHPL